MIAVGIDLGGTKIETQVFDEQWQVVARQRVPTPSIYKDLVQAVTDQIAWADDAAGIAVPVGIGAAGLLNPVTGHVLAANHCAAGKPLAADITKSVGRDVIYVNDSRALALSEAVFGAGRGHRTVMSLILGTGVGGGVVIDRDLLRGPTGTGGEFGHTSASAASLERFGLPIHQCGCGRSGCVETYISGPGMTRIAQAMKGQDATPQDIVAQRSGDLAKVWSVWCALTGDLLRNLILTVDPDVIILGGGLSKIDGVAAALMDAAKLAQIGDFDVPPILVAEGGDTSGARGAAYAAWRTSHDDE